MLPLRTEATIEAMNMSTGRLHPCLSYNEHNLFRQFGFTHKKSRKQHKRRREGHRNLELEGVIETLTLLLQSRGGDFFIECEDLGRMFGH